MAQQQLRSCCSILRPLIMISRTFTARLFPLACLSSALPITHPHVPFRSSTPSTLSFFFVAATAPHACIPVQMCMHDWFNETMNARAVQGRRRPCMQVRRGAPAAAGGQPHRHKTTLYDEPGHSCKHLWMGPEPVRQRGQGGQECSRAVSPLSWGGASQDLDTRIAGQPHSPPGSVQLFSLL